jgi:phosphoribosylaminoimidazolecarboxamide formyltransferase/IMP cyclohydrolase
MSVKKIQSALISVYYKDGLAPIIQELHKNGVTLYSTGGTQSFIEELGIPVIAVEDLTGYPSIFGGRVKTLHPKVFGGILHRRDLPEDVAVAKQYDIPALDLVMVDLYPFEETVASGASDEDIIEKIDIGGISLIRGGAKNFNDVLIVSSRDQYAEVSAIFAAHGSTSTTLEERRSFAGKAFAVSSHYDGAIQRYFAGQSADLANYTTLPAHGLRYGENPHQQVRNCLTIT